jgi:hypothetical protein
VMSPGASSLHPFFILLLTLKHVPYYRLSKTYHDYVAFNYKFIYVSYIRKICLCLRIEVLFIVHSKHFQFICAEL